MPDALWSWLVDFAAVRLEGHGEVEQNRTEVKDGIAGVEATREMGTERVEYKKEGG